jgi:hypothetical protein
MVQNNLTKASGRIINLFKKEPVIAHKTGILEETNLMLFQHLQLNHP